MSVDKASSETVSIMVSVDKALDVASGRMGGGGGVVPEVEGQ